MQLGIKELFQLLGLLNKQEMNVLALRYGWGGEKTHSPAEIARSLDMTRERVHQIQARAVSKLKKYWE